MVLPPLLVAFINFDITSPAEGKGRLGNDSLLMTHGNGDVQPLPRNANAA